METTSILLLASVISTHPDFSGKRTVMTRTQIPTAISLSFVTMTAEWNGKFIVNRAKSPEAPFSPLFMKDYLNFSLLSIAFTERR